MYSLVGRGMTHIESYDYIHSSTIIEPNSIQVGKLEEWPLNLSTTSLHTNEWQHNSSLLNSFNDTNVSSTICFWQSHRLWCSLSIYIIYMQFSSSTDNNQWCYIAGRKLETRSPFSYKHRFSSTQKTHQPKGAITTVVALIGHYLYCHWVFLRRMTDEIESRIVISKRKGDNEDGNEEKRLRVETQAALALVEKQNITRSSTLLAPTMLLTGHQAAVYTLKFDSTGLQLASAGADRAIFLWDTRGECHNYNVLQGHKNVSSLRAV